MLTLFIALGTGVLYIVAYHTYGRWLARVIFQLDPDAITPAVEQNDGVDYVPTRKSIVFGHHFTSIAGTGPIVGPAIAVIWGWLPALLWVVIGSIVMGAVHDFGALVISMRHKGKTVGDVIGDLVNPRARVLFLLVMFFALLLVIALFGLVIAKLFARYPSSVFPVWFEIPLAVAVGWIVTKRTGWNLTAVSLGALAIMYATVWMGAQWGQAGGALNVDFGDHAVVIWTVILLVYAFIASTLPVQVLLQPRDFINSHQLLVAMGLVVMALLWTHPDFVAPALRVSEMSLDKAAPLFFPFIFITISCGAISGFHCLVSSGTTSKQIRRETDAQFVGYGSMLTEGMLATLVILACTAGVGLGAAYGGEPWEVRYETWEGANSLGAKIGAFVDGSAYMITDTFSWIGVDIALATTIMGVFVVSFAATTLDTATRLQRYVITELAHVVKIKPLTNRYIATGVAVLTAGVLALWDGKGKGVMILWPLFGTVNQLLASLGLLTATIWLYRRARPVWYTIVPMAFMVVVASYAMIWLILNRFIPKGEYHLLIIGGLIFALEIWMLVESALVWLELRGRPAEARLEATGGDD